MSPPGVWIARYRIVSDDQHLLRQSGNLGIDVLNSFHDQRSGSATLHGCFGDAVDVRMIPIESRRFVQWKLHVVLKGLAGINHGVDHFILMTGGRRVGAVIVDVDGGGRHRHGAADAGRLS